MAGINNLMHTGAANPERKSTRIHSRFTVETMMERII